MSTVLGRSLALALGGLVAGLGLVLALFGGDLRERWAPAGDAAAPRTLAAPPSAGTEGGPVAALPGGAPPAGPGAASPPAPVPPVEGPGREAAQVAPGPAAKADPAVPSFDIVRVEPNGDSVVAGRAPPEATVEVLVDGKPVARAKADRDGQFAIVPPPLPKGASEIVLRATGADGREVRSSQSVAVALPATPTGKPLVALTAPDRPTAILSQPDAPATQAPSADATRPAKPTPLRIASVDAQENGRLFVSSEAPPGAAVRLYLNDTLIAPGRAGADGKVTFTIGKGVRPGAYRIRVDQIDSETGKVRVRAEVPFTVPEPSLRVATRTAPEPARPPGQTAAPKPDADRAAAAKPDIAKPDVAKSETAKPEPARPIASAPAAENPAARPSPGPAQPARPGAQAALAEPTQRAPAAEASPPRPAPAEPPGPARGGNAAEPPRTDAGSAARAGTPTDGSTRDAAPSAPARPAEAAPPRTADAAPGAQPAPGSVFVAEISTARIERGNSLWQISRRTYGRGNRYTVIYDANQDQIRDPDLIYPGQIFVLPEDKADPAGAKRG